MNVKEMSLPMPKNGKPMTEQEYIQTCNTEQLAELLAFLVLMALLTNKHKHSLHMTYPAYWIEWLKQPHHESVTKCNE